MGMQMREMLDVSKGVPCSMAISVTNSMLLGALKKWPSILKHASGEFSC
jgi:hypothetical protein